DKIKYLRKKQNYTQQQVADILGIDRSTYSFYEIGKTRPKLEMLKSLAKIFKVSVDDLLDDDISENDSLVSSPKLFNTPQFDDKLNDLSDFEKLVVFKTRLMSASQKSKLLEYLSDSENVSY
ncbi:MAG: helix-turn-helix domain-containing protein, partial [Eubacterium sp.]|nr:helix-turn-helix domain-containing protein [Eubacterium sp.]